MPIVALVIFAVVATILFVYTPPPAFRLPAMPAPPATINAPVVVLVLVVVLLKN